MKPHKTVSIGNLALTVLAGLIGLTIVVAGIFDITKPTIYKKRITIISNKGDKLAEYKGNLDVKQLDSYTYKVITEDKELDIHFDQPSILVEEN